jgi:predicted nucleic acid-binding protein
MNYLVDTNILIRFFQKRQQAIDLLVTLKANGVLAISVLTFAEVRTGWTEEQAARLLPLLYKMVKVEPVTAEIAELSGRLRHKYRTQGKQLATVDIVIAATAIIANYSLVTYDKDFYPVKEIQFYL